MIALGVTGAQWLALEAVARLDVLPGVSYLIDRAADVDKVANVLVQCGVPEQQAREAVEGLAVVVAVGRKRNALRETVHRDLQDSLGVKDLGVLTAAADNPAVQRWAKGLALQSDNERQLLDTRVLHDVRPVFDDRNDELVVSAAMVTHALRLSYVEGGEVCERQFAMTLDDVEKLRVQLCRAQRADRALRTMIEKAGTRDALPPTR